MGSGSGRIRDGTPITVGGLGFGVWGLGFRVSGLGHINRRSDGVMVST